MPQGPIPTLSGLMARTFARIAAAASSLQTALAAAANGQITSPLVGDQNGNLVVSGHGGTASKLAVSNTAGAIWLAMKRCQMSW